VLDIAAAGDSVLPTLIPVEVSNDKTQPANVAAVSRERFPYRICPVRGSHCTANVMALLEQFEGNVLRDEA